MQAARPEVTPDTAPPGGYARRAASGSIWTTAQTLLNKSVTVFATLLLARLLDPAEIGLGNFAVSIAVFAFVLAPFVMGDVLLARAKDFDAVGATASSVAWTAGVLQCLGLCLLAVPIERLTGKAGLAFLILIAAMRPLANATLMLPESRMRLDLAYSRIAQVDGTVILGATVLGVVMAWLGAGAVSVTLPPILTLAVRGLSFRWITRGRLPSRRDPAVAFPLFRSFAVASLGQYFNNLRMVLEVLVLGVFASEAEVGYFGMAFTLAIQANSVVAGQLGAVLQPIFGHLGGDPVRQVRGFLRATKLVSALLVPVSLLQAALALPLFGLLFPSSWAPSAPILAALSIGQAFVFVSAPSIALLKSQGRFTTYLGWQGCQLLASICLFVSTVLVDPVEILRITDLLGLPITAESARPFMLAVSSSLSWAVFCPIAYWLATRPARIEIRTILGVFLEPWVISIPVAGAVMAAWLLLGRSLPQTWSDAMTLTVIGPAAAVAAVAGSLYLRDDTRADFRTLVDRFRRRRSASP